jgi:hypothetical protein
MNSQMPAVERIAILGWGSLIWDTSFTEFDKHRGPWSPDGPQITIEFSRISESRDGALTLVVDPDHGEGCTVHYAFSTRGCLEDVVCDLRCREGTTWASIGFVLSDGLRHQGRHAATTNTIREWLRAGGASKGSCGRISNRTSKSTVVPPSRSTRLYGTSKRSIRRGRRRRRSTFCEHPLSLNTPLRRALQGLA